MGNKVSLGSVVSLYYRGGLKGEEPVDERMEGDPLTVMIGDMKLPRGIEQAVVGMEAGEEKRIDVAPELGYGEYQDALAKWYPKAMLDDWYSLKVGDVLFYTNPNDGSRQPAFVVDTTEDTAKLDFNHPFAGKTLDYWVKVVDVK